MSEFLAKVLLRRYQRTLVQNFSKYQIDDTTNEQEREKLADDLFNAISVINDAEGMLDDEIAYDPELTEKQKELLTEVIAKFDPVGDDIDRVILKEVTKFKLQGEGANEWFESDWS